MTAEPSNPWPEDRAARVQAVAPDSRLHLTGNHVTGFACSAPTSNTRARPV